VSLFSALSRCAFSLAAGATDIRGASEEDAKMNQHFEASVGGGMGRQQYTYFLGIDIWLELVLDTLQMGRFL
jgi:hypothetical protein